MDNSIYKQCTECGQTKHISEFSKSYPNRCKACVAEHTRQARERAKQEQNCAGNTDNRIETIKARIKVTGEVVDVKPSGHMQISCGAFITKDGRRIPGTALEFEENIDWEQRRYEIAKSVITGLCANRDISIINNGNTRMVNNGIRDMVELSIRCSNALIAELKKGGKE